MSKHNNVVPVDQQEDITCPTCHRSWHIATMPEAWPHLYCTRCNNVYHEITNREGYAYITSNWQRRRAMNTLESQAPVCECTGLFLFNAHPKCPHCKQDLHLFDHTPGSHQRLLHSDMVVFPHSKEYQETGRVKAFQFEEKKADDAAA